MREKLRLGENYSDKYLLLIWSRLCLKSCLYFCLQGSPGPSAIFTPEMFSLALPGVVGSVSQCSWDDGVPVPEHHNSARCTKDQSPASLEGAQDREVGSAFSKISVFCWYVKCFSPQTGYTAF